VSIGGPEPGEFSLPGLFQTRILRQAQNERLLCILSVSKDASSRITGLFPGTLAWLLGVLKDMRLTSAEAWVIGNTFLAFIPVVLAQLISWMAGLSRKGPLVYVPLVVAAAAWLVFLPNTCYLLTEWRHFLATLDASDLYLRARMDSAMTLRLMTYTAFYFCYSGVGMLAFTLAIRPIARLTKRYGFNKWVFGIALFVLLSAGVYLGLVLRYNSWDLIARPRKVWASVAGLLSRPKLSAFVIGFGGFLALAYMVIDIWIDGFMGRWKQAFGRQPAAE
jgi:uncharacterized membrane protein